MALSLPSPRLAARVIALAAIGFVSLFALDAFGHSQPLWVQIKGFLMHLIPSFVLLIAFFIAYKRELVGGIIFILIGLANAPWIFSHNYAMNQSIPMSLMIITILLAPFIIAGILFLISYFKTKKANPGA